MTETEDTVKPLNKTKSISSASLYDNDTKKQQSKEIKFRNYKLRSDTPSVSSMSVYGAIITTVWPDKDRIPCKDKKAQKFSSQEMKLLKNQTNQVKNKKWILSLMKKT